MINSSIYEKIENKGASDAKEINRIGQEKAKEIEDSILGEAKKEVANLISKAQKRNDDIVKTRMMQMEQGAKQRSLLKKREIINDVFKAAQQRLKNLNDEEFIRLVMKMIQKDTLHGNETLKVSKDEQARYIRLFTSGKTFDNGYLLDRLNSLLGKPNYQLKLSRENADISGGFVIISDHYDIDHSYKTMLDNMKEQFESEIADMLFNGD